MFLMAEEVSKKTWATQAWLTRNLLRLPWKEQLKTYPVVAVQGSRKPE